MRSKLWIPALALLLLVGCAALVPSAPDSVPAPTVPSVETEAALPEPTTEPTEPATEASSAVPKPEPFVYCGLVDIAAIDDTIIIDQRYATEDNFTGTAQYDRVLCLVQEDIAPMLVYANALAKEQGLRLKIWDAYRPISVQQALHESAPAALSAYVPAPGPYSMHARGITVDVTLCDEDGNELAMPTAFDDFSTSAHSDYTGASDEQIANRELLNDIMSTAGFQRSTLEWWHFDGPNRDSYEILDVSFAEYEAARDEAAGH